MTSNITLLGSWVELCGIGYRDKIIILQLWDSPFMRRIHDVYHKVFNKQLKLIIVFWAQPFSLEIDHFQLLSIVTKNQRPNQVSWTKWFIYNITRLRTSPKGKNKQLQVNIVGGPIIMLYQMAKAHTKLRACLHYIIFVFSITPTVDKQYKLDA